MSVSGIGQSYYQNSVATTKNVNNTEKFALEKTDGTKELPEAEKMEAFKKEMWKEINSLSWGSSISIQITDKAFEKMMNDSEFKNKMMNLIREDASGSNIMCGGTLINIDENGYSGYSYMADHAKEAGTAFSAHSSDKRTFYSKKATNKSNSNDLTWYYEKQRRERELQQELRNKEYFQHKEMTEYWNKRQSAAASYEANVMTETVTDMASLLG
ncbi:MAG: hypothetical protein K1W37_22690 [Lachnospiraceae bacterium]